MVTYKKNRISQLVELARLAVYWQVEDNNLELLITKRTREVVIFNQTFETKESSAARYQTSYSPNAFYFTESHIKSVSLLPDGHQLQDLLIQASVQPYIRKYAKDVFCSRVQRLPSFLERFLYWYTKTMNTIVPRVVEVFDRDPCTVNTSINVNVFRLNFHDPFSGTIVDVGEGYRLTTSQQLVPFVRN
jgi:hypothetical protein